MTVIGTARTAIISDTPLNGLCRITFEVGCGQVVEVVRRYIVATGTGKTSVCAVFARHGAVILASTGRMARCALGTDIQRTARPVGSGLAAVAAGCAAGLIGAVVIGDTALGIIGRRDENAGRIGAGEMAVGIGARILMAYFTLAGDAGQGVVHDMGSAAVGELIAGGRLPVGRLVVAGGATGKAKG